MLSVADQNRMHIVDKTVKVANEAMETDGVLAFVDEMAFDAIDFGSFEVSLEVALDRAGISLFAGATSAATRALSVVQF